MPTDESDEPSREPLAAARAVIASARRTLDSFDRVNLAHRPTPLERCDRLSEALGGPELWVKRDDCTGLAFGGNKTRKLDFLLGRALADDASRLGTFGAMQSNHARQTAAAAARFGLGCDVVLNDPVNRHDTTYERNGNQLLYRILGATVHTASNDAESEAAIAEVESAAEEEGTIVSWIPLGGSSPVGALGYVEAAVELVEQAVERDVGFHRAVVAASTCGTYAGLVAGMALLGAATTVTGFDISDPELRSRAATRTLLDALADLLGIDPIGDDRVDLVVAAGDGYGKVDAATVEAIELAARTEGLVLDPVYTGKAMARLITCIREGLIGDDERVIFVHTGGGPGVFAYEGEFA